MTPIFYHNWNNGFSGGIIYDSYYYALFGIIITNIAICFFMILDEDVDYNYEKYLNLLKPSDPEKLKKYDPTAIDWKDLKHQDRLEYLEERGISHNSDGSTNNLPEYFWYLREC